MLFEDGIDALPFQDIVPVKVPSHPIPRSSTHKMKEASAIAFIQQQIGIFFEDSFSFSRKFNQITKNTKGVLRN